MLKKLDELSLPEMEALLDTALDRRAADLIVSGGRIVDLYTGEVRKANVLVAGNRIAYVGPEEPRPDFHTQIINAENLLVVPGYLEPHAHPDMLYSPLSIGSFLLSRGTTTVVGDATNLFGYLGRDGFSDFNQYMQAEWPANFYWTARIFFGTLPSLQDNPYRLKDLEALLEIDEVLGLGETSSRWVDLLQGEPEPLESLRLAYKKGKIIDGHTSGASKRKLAALAGLGIAGCHESLTVEQARERLANGMYAVLRHSSQRADLPALLELYRSEEVDTSKIIFTGDGALGDFLSQHAHPGAMASLAIHEGVKPILALRAVSLNPATYLRLDRHLGSVTPGRLADFNLVESWERLELPEVVVSGGRVVAAKGSLKKELLPPWPEHIRFPEWIWPSALILEEEFLAIKAASGEGSLEWPVIDFAGTMITQRRNLSLPVQAGKVALPAGQSLAYLNLVNWQGKTLSQGIVGNLGGGIAGFATSLICLKGSLLLLGNNFSSICRAGHRVREMGGGMALVEGEKVIWELPLDISGRMSRLGVAEVNAAMNNLEVLVRERGYGFDNFLNSLFFLPGDFMPYIRLTIEGVYDVVRQQVLYPSTSLAL